MEHDIEMLDEDAHAQVHNTSSFHQEYFHISNNSTSSFDDLPIQLYNEVFKYLTISERNKIREVSASWDHAIKYAFGLKIILHNHNIDAMSSVNDITDIQVRNLTRKLPEPLSVKIFEYGLKVSNLEIMGMILSTNLLKLLTEFKNITTLKLSRVYLETDRLLRLNDELKVNLPKNLTHFKMTFLKTFHHKNYLRFSRGRNTTTDLYTLTSSDNIMLNFVQHFNLEKLKTLELYHDMSDDVKTRRHSEMVNRIRSQIQIQNQNQGQGQGQGHEQDPIGGGDGPEMFQEQMDLANPNQNPNLEFLLQEDFDSDGIRGISNIILKLLSFETMTIENLKIDNLPQLALSSPDAESIQNNLINLQFSHLDINGILDSGWKQILEVQKNLKSLEVSILDSNMLQTVKNTARRCQKSLETFSIVLGTPDALILNSNIGGNIQNEIQNIPLQQDQNQDQDQDQYAEPNFDFELDMDDPTDFDTSFLNRCNKLKQFKMYYAPYKIDLRGISTLSLTSVELCGKIKVEEIKELLIRAPKIECLKLDICSGPHSSDVPNPSERERNLFSQDPTIKSILANSSITKLVISESGAFDCFKSFLIFTEHLQIVRATLDFIEYRTSTSMPLLPLQMHGVGLHGIGPEDAGRLTFVTVPRITVLVLEGNSNQNSFHIQGQCQGQGQIQHQETRASVFQ